MLLTSGCQTLFLVTFQAFTINGGEGACDEVILKKAIKLIKE